MGFRTMLVGFIFILFNINLGNINILPDVIGYGLLFLGSITLRRKFDNEFFSRVKSASLILIILSSLDLLKKHTEVLYVLNNSQTIEGKVFSFLFYLTIVSLFLYCVYNLCRGIEKEANLIESKGLASKSRKVFKIFAIYQLAFFLFLGIGTIGGSQEFHFSGQAALFIFIVVAIILIYVFVQMFSLLNQAEKTFIASYNEK
ncbi:hypothetical protein ACQKP0_18505 [Heyndrickxia sp. NPDC080065]|uniref:hypothetical protein n=1 Tax=Heyndrickxia sp. NPDC080065 TaxID=3390568 RepID=UPI003D031B33